MLEDCVQLPLGGDFYNVVCNPFHNMNLIDRYTEALPERQEWRQLSLDSYLMYYLAKYDPREYRKLKFGCVLRAIESLTSEKAPDSAWDLRLSQIDQTPQPLMELVLGEREPGDLEEELEWLRIREEDFVEIRDLLMDLRKSKTPLGDKLKKFDIRQRLLGIEDIKMMLLEGPEILLLTFNHLAHLSYNKKENILRSKSDESLEVFLERGAYYQTFIFNKKKPRRGFFRS